MAQDNVETSHVGVAEAVEHVSPAQAYTAEKTLDEAYEAGFSGKGTRLAFQRDFRLTPQQGRAHHGRCCQGYGHGNEHGHREDNGEFSEQASERSRHAENRDEDGHQRKRHGNDGEADFTRSPEGGAERCFTEFKTADDVFEDNDGVIHHKTGGYGEGHEGKIVQRVAADIHDGKCADKRDRSRDRGDGRCPGVPEKEKDHEDDQGHGEEQAFFHFAERGAYGDGFVHTHVEVYILG